VVACAAVFYLLTGTTTTTTFPLPATAVATVGGPIVITEDVAPTDEPVAPGVADANLIVYTCFDGSYDQVCIMNADGTNQNQLTSGKAASFYPSLSPDGTKILFASNRTELVYDIFSMNTDGTGVTQLTHKADAYAPMYSPDSSQIVYVSTVEGSEDLWLMNADGTGTRQLTVLPGREVDPTWSQDGTRIAYTGNYTGNNEIYIVNVDGTETKQVTNGSEQEDGGRIDWSPDGLTIAFYAGPRGDKNLYLVDVSCADQPGGCTPDKFHQLTNGGNAKAPMFSPDGLWVVYAAGPTTENDIYIMKLDGSKVQQLTTAPGSEYQPRWGW
jgi:TolB protein